MNSSSKLVVEAVSNVAPGSLVKDLAMLSNMKWAVEGMHSPLKHTFSPLQVSGLQEMLGPEDGAFEGSSDEDGAVEGM